MAASIIAIRTVLIATALLCGVALHAASEDLAEPPQPVGTWRGELEQGEGPRARTLQLVLRIRRAPEGFTGTLEGIGGTPGNLALENMVLVEDVLSFQVAQAEGRFAGNFYGDSLRGTWSRGESSWSLIFYRD